MARLAQGELLVDGNGGKLSVTAAIAGKLLAGGGGGGLSCQMAGGGLGRRQLDRSCN